MTATLAAAESTGVDAPGRRPRRRGFARRLSRIWSRPLGRIGVAVLALAVVAAPAVAVWAVMRGQSASAAAPAVTSTTVTATAATSTFEKSVSGTGTLTPTVQDALSFAASGTVTAVEVAVGDTVEAGQVLATIDTLQLDAALAAARASLATAQAQLAAAEDDDDGSDAAAAQIESRQAAVEVAQAAYDDAEASLADATLTAPHAGLVTAVTVAVGDVVGSGGGLGGNGASDTSAAAFEIVGTDAWEVTVDVSENDVADVAAGNQVELTGDSLTDTVFGTVTSVALLPSTGSNAVTYPVTIAVTGSPEGLHDGVSVTATIIYERRSGVLTVPSAAVTTADDGATTVDVVGEDGSVTATDVTLGDRNGQDVEVTDGLSEGQTVQYTQTTVNRTGSGSGNGQRVDSFELPDGMQLPEGFTPPDGAGPGGGFPGGQMRGGGQ